MKFFNKFKLQNEFFNAGITENHFSYICGKIIDDW